MTDKLLFALPSKIANDPELAPFFNQLVKVVYDLSKQDLAPTTPTTGGSKITNIYVEGSDLVFEYE